MEVENELSIQDNQNAEICSNNSNNNNESNL